MSGGMRGLLPVALLVAACGRPDGDNALGRATVDTLQGGIVRVVNNGATEWGDTNGWKLVLEREVQPGPDSLSNLGQPGGIVADSRGNVYVLDHKPVGIKVFNAEGSYTQTIGRDGSGPGEFRQYGILMISRDTLIHHGPRQGRTQLFALDGTLIATWSTMCCHQRPLIASRDGMVPVPGTIKPDTSGSSTAMFSGSGVVRYGLDGSVVDTMMFPPEPDQPVWRMGDKDNWSINTIPFQPGLTTRFLEDGTMLWGVQGSYRLIVSRTGRDTVRIIESSAESVPLPDSLRVQAVEQQVKEDPRWAAVAKLDDIPTNYPTWTSATGDGAGNIWVLVPGPRGESDRWDVFTAEGVLRGRVPAMFEGTYRTYWTADRVYTIGEGDDGAYVIRVWSIQKG